MSIFSFRLAVVAVAAAAVFSGACGDAQEGRGGRGGAAPTSAFGPGQPAFHPTSPNFAGPLAEAPPPVRSGAGPGSRGATNDVAPVAAPTSVAGQTSRKVDTPARFAGGIAAQNAARADAGLKSLVWSVAREDEARTAVASIAAQTCSRSLAERMGLANDVSAYWAPAMRQLDGTGAAQDLSSSFVVSEWLQERSRYSASGCSRKGACENYTRMIRPAARTIGCAIAVCSDQSQVWACRYGD